MNLPLTVFSWPWAILKAQMAVNATRLIVYTALRFASIKTTILPAFVNGVSD